MKSKTLWTVLLLASVAFSGCLGGGEEAEGETTTDTNGDGGGGAGVNATATAGGNQTNETGDVPTGTNATGGDEDEGPETETEERPGTAESSGVAPLDQPSEESFTVKENAVEITFEVNASGGELQICIIEPGGSDCSETLETQDGTASTTIAGPTPGDWTLQLTPAGTGPQSVQYNIVFRQGLASDSEGGQPTGTDEATEEPAETSPTG